MKKFTSFLVIILFALSACNSPNETVPKKVNNTFIKKFPQANEVKWEKENKTAWEADFILNGRKFSTVINTDGVWKETEYDIKLSEIPPVAKATIDSLFHGYEIEDAAVFGNAKMKVVKVELKNEKGKVIVTIDRSGKVLEKKAAEKENEKNHDVDKN